MASLISGKTGKSLIALIRGDYITAAGNVRVDRRTESGTFLSRIFKAIAGVCCVDGACQALSLAACTDAGGIFLSDVADCTGREESCNCDSPDIGIKIVSTTFAKCGFSPYHKSTCVGATDLGYGTEFTFLGCSAEYGNCAASVSGDSDPTKLYLTETTTISGSAANPGCSTSCETCGSYTYAQTYNIETCLLEDGDSSGDPLVCCATGIEPAFSHPISGGSTLSEEYTDSMLWGRLAAWSPDLTCEFTNSRGEFGLDISQQYSAPEGGPPAIDTERACWAVRAPDGYTGYMKVWVYKHIDNYDGDGVFLSSTDALYAIYEGTGGGLLSTPAILSIPTAEGTNQHVQIYIRNYTCQRDLDCNTDYPYPNGCIPAGGF
jgi:hypothetical protein